MNLSMLGRVYEFNNVFHRGQECFGNIRLYQIGEICCEAGFEIGNHRQWCYEISYIMSGEGTFFTNGRPCVVRTNDIYLNGHNEEHQILANRGTQLRYMYLGFDITEPERLKPGFSEILRLFDTIQTPCMQDRSGVSDILRKTIQEFYWDQACFSEIVEASLRLVIHLAYRNALSNAPAVGIKTISAESVGNTVYSIIRYVDDHVCEIAAIRDLAEKLGYSYTYISHLFRNKTGVTLQQYIQRKKMEKAAELMTDIELTVSQTAERLGYQGVQAFSKAFRSIFSESPTAYIGRVRKAGPAADGIREREEENRP